MTDQNTTDAVRERPMSTADLASAGEQPGEAATTENIAAKPEDQQQPLFPASEAGELRNRWNDIQTGFVDEPRRAVQDADALVATAMKRLAETFAAERSQLESQWDRGENVSTEDLRVALQRYRSFFSRLLAV